MLIQFCDTRTPLPKKNECFFRQRTYLHLGSSSFSNCSVFRRICILISFSMENIVMCYRFCEPINTLNSFPVASQMLVNNFCHVTCLALVSDSHALEKKTLSVISRKVHQLGLQCIITLSRFLLIVIFPFNRSL